MVSTQIEEQIEEHKEVITTVQIEVLEEDKNPIEDPEEHMTKDKDSKEGSGRGSDHGQRGGRSPQFDNNNR